MLGKLKKKNITLSKSMEILNTMDNVKLSDSMHVLNKMDKLKAKDMVKKKKK